MGRMLSLEQRHPDVQGQRHNGHVVKLFNYLEDDLRVWVSHGNEFGALPASFILSQRRKMPPLPGNAHRTKPIYRIQFQPEVTLNLRRETASDNAKVRRKGVFQEFELW